MKVNCLLNHYANISYILWSFEYLCLVFKEINVKTTAFTAAAD